MEPREEEVMARLEEIGAVLTGHFVLTSGNHSNVYINKDTAGKRTVIQDELARALAYMFRDAGTQVVVAPEKGAISLGNRVAFHLTMRAGRSGEVVAVYAERKERSIAKALKAPLSVGEIVLHPGEELFVREVGFSLKRGFEADVAGKRALVIEDIFTTGGTVLQVIKAVQIAGGTVVGAGGLCLRGKLTAEDLGVPNFTPLTRPEFQMWSESECPLCREGVPVNTNVGKGKHFLARQAQ